MTVYKEDIPHFLKSEKKKIWPAVQRKEWINTEERKKLSAALHIQNDGIKTECDT